MIVPSKTNVLALISFKTCIVFLFCGAHKEILGTRSHFYSA